MFKVGAQPLYRYPRKTNTAVVNFTCKTCVSPPVAAPNLLPEKIIIGTGEFESDVDFCYLVDALGQAGVCTDAATARIRSAWKSFHGLLPFLPTMVLV